MSRRSDLQLQPVEPPVESRHPDFAILDRISDSVAREVYRIHLEDQERRGRELDTDDFDDWEDDDG